MLCKENWYVSDGQCLSVEQYFALQPDYVISLAISMATCYGSDI